MIARGGHRASVGWRGCTFFIRGELSSAGRSSHGEPLSPDDLGGRVPAPQVPTPSSRVPSTRCRVDVAAREQDADVVPSVSRVGCDETDGAMPMLAIVPVDEPRDPRPRGVDGFEGLARGARARTSFRPRCPRSSDRSSCAPGRCGPSRGARTRAPRVRRRTVRTRKAVRLRVRRRRAWVHYRGVAYAAIPARATAEVTGNDSRALRREPAAARGASNAGPACSGWVVDKSVTSGDSWRAVARTPRPSRSELLRPVRGQVRDRSF
jgi:hypothetical protein